MNHYILRILALTLTMLALPALAKANPITLPSDEAPQVEATTISTINEASNFTLSIQKGHTSTRHSMSRTDIESIRHRWEAQM